MRTHRKATLILTLVLVLAIAVPVMAQEGGQEDDIPVCTGEGVSGTVVAVDEETGVVTIDTGDPVTGQCTVTLDGAWDHPIVALLGSYFGDVSAGDLTEALENTQGCAVYNADSDTWTWADCEDEGAVPVTVSAENEDGTFAATVTIDGEEQDIAVTVDDTTAENLSVALEALLVEWNLDEDGAVVQPGDEIAAYHEAGLGFGELVKLYALAAMSQEMCADEEEPSDEPCGVTVEELVEAFQSGAGMGELFQEYGRPTILGVGHVRGNGRPDHAGPRGRPGRPGDDVDDTDGDDDADLTEHASPSDQPGHGGPPDHAGPKDNGGQPDHAGPPEHAGPKGSGGQSNHGGPKKNK